MGRHRCSLRKRGGFEKRLREGTWLGHVVEHVALELQTLAGSRAIRGKTRSVKNRPGVYNVLFAYNEEKVGLAAGRTALELVDSLLPAYLSGVKSLGRIWDFEGAFDLDRRMDALKRLVRRNRLGPTTRSLVDEAARRGIPGMRLDDRGLIQRGRGKFQQRIRAPITGRTSRREALARQELTRGSTRAASRCRAASSCASREAVRRRESALPARHQAADGNHCRGVTVAIALEEQRRSASRRRSARPVAATHRRALLHRNDHRILVSTVKMIAVAERVPARWRATASLIRHSSEVNRTRGAAMATRT